MEHYAWTLGLTRMISAVFRRGGDVSFVAEELKAVFDPRGGSWIGGRYVPSLLAAIGGVIERHLDLAKGERGAAEADLASAEPAVAARPSPAICPRCGGQAVLHKEGCDTCMDCGYSKCGLGRQPHSAPHRRKRVRRGQSKSGCLSHPGRLAARRLPGDGSCINRHAVDVFSG